MKNKIKHIGLALLGIILMTACEDFLDIETPKNQIDQALVFSNDRMAVSALTNVYSQMRDLGFFSGSSLGSGFLLGCYTDELEVTNPRESSYKDFYELNILSDNSSSVSLWNSSYNQIYAVNNVIQGLEKSSEVSDSVKQQLKGEALAIRGMIHFYLTQTFGNIPYIISTDYEHNKTAGKSSVSDIISKVVEDFTEAEKLLIPAYPSGEKIRINKTVVQALLARVFLYQENWVQAQHYAQTVINNPDYQLETIDKVFVKESKSALWQFKPEAEGRNTQEAAEYIFENVPAPNVRLSEHLLTSFESNDLRYSQWIRFIGDDKENASAYKYKQKGITSPSLEYSIVIRLEEMYLILAEGAAEMGDWNTCNTMLNTIRNRSGLSNLEVNSYTNALRAILQERRVEFFCEYGHRFYDLKRTKKLSDLKQIKPNWQEYFKVLPLPENEILLNPNLLPQNTGY